MFVHRYELYIEDGVSYDLCMITFLLDMMTFSAGIYSIGKTNLQLKFPVPSNDL